MLIADLAGDLPAVLGVPEPDGPGLAGWLGAGPGVPADALARLERRVGPGVGLLARGSGRLAADRADVLAGLLAADPRPVVADCGRLEPDGAPAVIAGAATRSLLVTRPCFLALRRAAQAPIVPSGVVLISESGRALGRPRRGGRRGRPGGRRAVGRSRRRPRRRRRHPHGPAAPGLRPGPAGGGVSASSSESCSLDELVHRRLLAELGRRRRGDPEPSWPASCASWRRCWPPMPPTRSRHG